MGPNSAKSVFLAAIAVPPAERADLVRLATAGDDALRERVEALLAAHDDPAEFLDTPAVQFGAAVDVADGPVPPAERPGSVIGPYTLLEPIGEGGMGVVYLAEQRQPVQRRVALKIIKPGMETRQVVARFEAERRALALMEHPQIARVLDAGATDSGRPYFVMELFRGQAITEYCAQRQLPLRARLDLFVAVCHALQHAHQKGIIHRDLKPSNVLVAEHEGRVDVKLIDFGIAKAIDGTLTEETAVSRCTLMVGTPLYMSPEQAESAGRDIDTRSDIYSLGAILYELATGTPPFDRRRLGEARYEDVLRIIREEEPPRPSVRTGGCDAGEALRRRGRRALGDLDWVVMKALEKDRDRRYATADALARDIERYLSDQPVEACPPSAAYRLRRFARRNRIALSTGLLVGLALVVGTAVSTWQAVRAVRAEKLAEGNFEQARHTVDEYFNFVSESKLLDVPGLQPLRADLLEAALRFYERLAARRPNDPAVLTDLAVTHLQVAVVYHSTDRNDEAVAALRKGFEIVERLRRDHRLAAAHRRKLAGFWRGRRSVQGETRLPRDPRAAFQALQRFCSLWEQFIAEDPSAVGFQSDLAATYDTVADLLTSSGNAQAGLAFLRKARGLWERLAREHPDIPEYRAEYARCCDDAAAYLGLPGHFDEARAALREALALREHLARDFPDVPQYQLALADSVKNVALSEARARHHDEAEMGLQRAVTLCRGLVERFPSVPLHHEQLVETQRDLTAFLESTGRVSDETAEQHRRQAIATVERLVVEFPADTFLRSHLARCHRDLAVFLKARGRVQEAIAAHRRELQSLPSAHPSQPRQRSVVAHAQLDLGALLIDAGQREEGAELISRAGAAFSKLAAEFPASRGYARDVEECRRRTLPPAGR